MHLNLSPPDYYDGTTITVDDKDFEVGQYFSTLNHIAIEEGYYLDYMFFYDELGGKPVLYSVKNGDGPFLYYEEYVAYLGEEMEWERSYMNLYYSYDYLQHITIDDTPEGFFQYLILVMLGDQFDLFWHALYNDTIIICDSSDINSVNSELEAWDVEFPDESAAKGPDIELTPYVIFDTDTVKVRFIQFSKWGGYAESIYTLDRQAPYKLLDVEWNVLIEYDCGIAF